MSSCPYQSRSAEAANKNIKLVKISITKFFYVKQNTHKKVNRECVCATAYVKR